jgi:hypothetical protein
MSTPRPAIGGGGSLLKVRREAVKAAKQQLKENRRVARREAKAAKKGSLVA